MIVNLNTNRTVEQKNYNIQNKINYQVNRSKVAVVAFTGMENHSEKKTASVKTFVNFINKKIVHSLEFVKNRLNHNVVVVSGPSGAGKDTIISEIIKNGYSMKTVVNYTTRKPRPKEVNGVDYYFISQKTFDEMNKRKEFFQQVELNGNSYGGTIAAVDALKKGHDVVLNISAEEAHKVRDIYHKRAVLIFINAPSMEELKQRLIKRGSETAEGIQKRLKYGLQQIENIKDFDKVIINNDFHESANEAIQYLRKRQHFSVKIINRLLAFMSKRIK